MIYRIPLPKNVQLFSDTGQTTSNGFLPRRYGLCLNLDEIKDRVQIETTKNKQLSWKFKMHLNEVKKECYLGDS